MLGEKLSPVKGKYIDIPEVGPVLFEKSRRARHINISIRPFRGLRVAVPYRASYNAAVEFVLSRIDWIRKHRKTVEKAEKEQLVWNRVGENINRGEAKKIISDRLRYLADRFGFDYKKVTIRNQKTRWGSCSARNNISLNVKLVLLPRQLMDYVILHELVHTKIKNHSPAFWKELNRYAPDAKKLRKKLRSFKLEV